MSNHRSWLCAVLVGLATVCATPTADAKSVRVSRIPQGRLAAVPQFDEVPKSIPSRAKVDGIFAVRPPKIHRSQEVTMAFIAPNKAIAQRLSREGFISSDAGESQHCFTAVPRFATRGRGGEEFPTEQSHVQQVWSDPRSADRVWILRSERLVRGADDEATLEIVDAYVDAVSLGARLISRSTLGLRRIASGPRNVDVYAARDHDKVHFVVTAADTSMLPKGTREIGRSLRSTTTADAGFSQCGFLRTAMQADGGGRAATVFVQVPIEIDDETADAARRGAGRGGPSRGAPMREAPTREATIREAAVHLSVSRTSSDRSVVVSVGFGWEGDAQRLGI